MTRILCLWFPNWPIQRAVRTRLELKGRPLVLVVSGPRGGEVAACCGQAAAQGVRPGMPVAESQSLVRNLMIMVYDAEADRQALVKCAEACERFSPCVAVEEGSEPESLLLDISNLEHLWGSESQLIEKAKAFFTSRGYIVRWGVGETVGVAWATAHFKGNPNDECRMTNGERTSSSFVIRQSSFALPVQSLRISEESAAMLRELGIETVGQLAALPREALAARFGEELLRRLDQLTGVGREVIEPRRVRPTFDVSYTLEEPTIDRGALLQVLNQLVEQLARQLAARDQGAVVLECFLYLAGGMSGVGDGRGASTAATPFAKPQGVPPECKNVPPQLLRVGLLQPSACARQVLELLELHLEAVKLAGEVNRVELRATVVGRLGERQGELFADRWSTNPHQLAVLVNRFTSRLGQNRVLRAELRASAVPERAVRWGEVARREARGTRQKDRGAKRGGDKERGRQGDKENFWSRNTAESPCLPFSPSPFPPRPLLLYSQPQAMEVVCVAPDGPPQAVWLGGRRESIVACAGPERIESLWWRGPSVRRDYYRVATDAGIHLWLFRELGDGRWFMHGIFG